MNKNSLAILVTLLTAILIVLIIIAVVLINQDIQPAESTSAPSTDPATTAATQPAATQPAPTLPATSQPTETTVPVIRPDRIGIYIPDESGSKTRLLLAAFSAPRTAKKDIDCFEILASNAIRVEGSSFSAMWTDAWNSHGDVQNARIGFRIAFTLADGTRIAQTIRKPSDAKSFYDYLEVYLYDDIHTGGGWYTHLEDENINEETVITSIKLTSGSKIAEVGDISLTAFIYNSDECFDANGNYIGDVQQTLIITE